MPGNRLHEANRIAIVIANNMPAIQLGLCGHMEETAELCWSFAFCEISGREQADREQEEDRNQKDRGR